MQHATATLNVERRLAAILSADAKGYSRLMADDEIGTVLTLTGHRAVMRETVGRLRGRVVDSPGDNLLAEFGNAGDAVEAAVEIQHALRARNDQLPDGRRLEFRIGVNLGEVLVQADRIYGDAVNVASRLESLADADGICISGIVHDQIVGKLSLGWEPLGEQRVKNIPRPVRAYRVRFSPAPRTSLTHVNAHRQTTAYRPSIAVLPFREVGIDDGHRYFGDGVVEDIIGALASLPDLFVVSRNSTARFRGDHIDFKSVRTVHSIAPHVQKAEIRRALRKRPENMDAYDFMLRGLDLLYRLKRSEFERARGMFEQSMALDPGYATPYALNALWYSIRRMQGWSDDRRADFETALSLAEAALER